MNQKIGWVQRNKAEVFLGVSILLAFVIFLLVLPNYGMSYDERDLYEYADRMLDAYSKMAYGEPITKLLQFYDLAFYGPYFLIVGRIIIYGLNILFPALYIVHAWHIVTFVTFLAGVWMIFLLAARFVEKKFALLASILFLTQPLLWGHAAMNLKDIPFLTFFLTSVVVGLRWVDCIKKSERNSPPKIRVTLNRKALSVGAPLMIGVALFFIDRQFNNFISIPILNRFISSVINSEPGTFHHLLYQKLIGSNEPLAIQQYILKASRIVNLVEFIILLAAAIIIFILLLRHIPGSWKWTIIAGLFSGFALGVRVLGPASAGLVFLYLLMTKPRKSGLWILGYTIVMFVTAYCIWPYLWGQPIQGLVNSLEIMSKFPWQGIVRFEGIDFPAGELPWYYLPKLIGIQFTMPVIVLGLVGFSLMAVAVYHKKPIWKLTILVSAWFWLPIALVMIARPTMYDNFRQFLFITPPLFISASYAASNLFGRIKSAALRAAIMSTLIIPGVVAGIWLHPYEYVYYNGFAGWTGAIERKYENDYWGLATCEAAVFLSNQTDDTEVVLFSDMVLAEMFKRCASNEFDIRIERTQFPNPLPNYAITITRFDDDIDYYRNLNTFYTISRGKTTFLVVKR